jgi:beta-lactamase regulating signal transducer with metallopeptidase domain
MTLAAWLLVLSAVVSAVLLVWLLVRWWQITRQVSRANTSERLTALMAKTQRLAGVRGQPPVKLTGNTMSPAVCGLFRPAILIPQALAEQFSDEQLRAVLLHELIHLRRRDVWLNFLQSLLQIVYWWHPLVWLANACTRRVREEAVDDAVMLALAGEAESYAPTLLEVAKLALNRPLASLGLVGILESRSALRQRIERLVDFRAPRRAGLTLASVFGVMAFTAVAVPMGGATGPDMSPSMPAAAVVGENKPQVGKPPEVLIEVKFYRMRETDLKQMMSNLKFNRPGIDNELSWSASPGEFIQLEENLKSVGFQPFFRPRIETSSGVPAEFHVGDSTNSVEVDCRPLVADGLIALSDRSRIIFTAAKVAVTNQFSEKIPIKDQGGLVVPLKNADGSTYSIVVAIVGVRIITNPATGNIVAMTFKLKTPIQEADLKNELAAAGIKSPPTSFFYAGNGILFVRGTADQLALADQVTLKSYGYSPEKIAAAKNNFMKNLATTPDADETTTNLVMRTFQLGKVFLDKFGRIAFPDTNNLLRVNGTPPGDPSIMFRDFFKALGVDLQSPAGKSIFYNDELGILFVKATEGDLGVIERALQAIYGTMARVHIKARFIEVPKGTWGTLAGLTNYNDATHSDQYIGVLTRAHFNSVLKALEQQKNSEALAEPEAITLTGRQTQMRATEFITVLTNFSFQETGIIPQQEQVETGPILDTVPYVLSDGYTINLTTIASVTKFLGYGSPTNTKTAYTSSGIVSLPSILPIFDTHQVVASFNLWDGQTVVMKGLIPSRADRLNNKPTNFSGHPFAVKNEPEKELVVFVTVEIVDAAGKRIHSESDMPFARADVPPQPPQPMPSAQQVQRGSPFGFTP